MEKVRFKFLRETKTTYRFEEEGENPKVGTIYVKKSVFGGKIPKEVIVTIEEVE